MPDAPANLGESTILAMERHERARPWNLWKPKVLPLVDVGELPPFGECLACGHALPLAIWREGTNVGICDACRVLALPNRGPCSHERGCRCARGGVSPSGKDEPGETE